MSKMGGSDLEKESICILHAAQAWLNMLYLTLTETQGWWHYLLHTERHHPRTNLTLCPQPSRFLIHDWDSVLIKQLTSKLATLEGKAIRTVQSLKHETSLLLIWSPTWTPDEGWAFRARKKQLKMHPAHEYFQGKKGRLCSNPSPL